METAPGRSRSGGSEPLCWFALLMIGAYTALLGPSLPDLAERTDASLGQTGAVFSALFGAGMLTSAVAGRFVDRFGARVPLLVGLLVDGAGLLLLVAAPSLGALLLAGLVIGAGDTAIVVSSHVLVGRLHPGEEAAALNRLNVFFGVGAVAGPALGAAVAFLGGTPLLLLPLVALGQAAAAALLARRPAWEDGGTAVSRAPRSRSALRSGRLLLLAFLLLVYVGLEIGLGAWAFTYARAEAGLGSGAAALLSGGFWCALTLGRLAAPAGLRLLPSRALLLAGSAIATLGVLALALAGGTPAVLVAGVLLAGFGFGPVWPVTFALAARAFPAAAGGASGVLATLAAAGGLSLPWLQGRLYDSAGAGAIIAVTLGGCLLLTALAAASERVFRGPVPAQ